MTKHVKQAYSVSSCGWVLNMPFECWNPHRAWVRLRKAWRQKKSTQRVVVVNDKLVKEEGVEQIYIFCFSLTPPWSRIHYYLRLSRTLIYRLILTYGWKDCGDKKCLIGFISVSLYINLRLSINFINTVHFLSSDSSIRRTPSWNTQFQLALAE